MNLLKCATHTVFNVDAAVERFKQWLDYRIAETGLVATDLAQSWGTPASAGRRYALCRPSSGADVFIRFVEGDAVESYKPIRTYGWAAIEICVQDVLAVNARLAHSPFEIIGPPAHVPGLSTIYPMQIRGPDQEVIYLTEIITKAPNNGLPQANALIDKPFILVLACADLTKTVRWFADIVGLDVGNVLKIPYSMIADAFDLPPERLHEIVTARYGQDVFLEFDQYPEAATARSVAPGALPPGVSICTLMHPNLGGFASRWLEPPVQRFGPLYGGRRVATLRTPEGALLEVLDAG